MLFFLIKKELLVELRSRQILISMAAFGLSVVLVFAFSFSVSNATLKTFAPGLFWVLTLFTAVLGLHRLFDYEKDFDAFSLAIGSPVDRGLIFLAKWISGFLYLVAAEVIIVPLFLLFLQLSWSTTWWGGIGILLLGNAGIMAIGALISGLSMRARMSEVLLPVLLYPLVTPVIIAATKATTGFLDNIPFNFWQFWVMILVTFVVIFALLGYLLFDYVTEE
ncbi:MAG: heme exporter protein CcmB [Fidelibacterota bacterium]